MSSLKEGACDMARKPRIVEQTDAGTARQQHGKHLSAAADTCATVEELLDAVFSTWSVPRLHDENHPAFEYLHRSPASCRKREPSAWPTLFLGGYKNMGT
jgi:hypothetical protein